MTTAEEDTIQLIENPFHTAESTTLDGLGPCPMEKYANVPGAPEPLPDPPQTPKRLIRKTKCNQCSGACFPKDELVPDMGASLSYAIGQVVEKQRKREAKFWTAMSNQDGRILKLQKQVAELKEKLAAAEKKLAERERPVVTID